MCHHDGWSISFILITTAFYWQVRCSCWARIRLFGVTFLDFLSLATRPSSTYSSTPTSCTARYHYHYHYHHQHQLLVLMTIYVCTKVSSPGSGGHRQKSPFPVTSAPESNQLIYWIPGVASQDNVKQSNRVTGRLVIDGGIILSHSIAGGTLGPRAGASGLRAASCCGQHRMQWLSAWKRGSFKAASIRLT